MYYKRLFTITIFLFFGGLAISQNTAEKPSDTLSKLARFSKKAESFFRVVPVPLISYSSEAGNTIGLAKFNAFKLSKKDTISNPSMLSGVVTVSSKGRVNFSIANDLFFTENKYMILSFFKYKKQPEYLLGIGNDVSIDDVEEVVQNDVQFSTSALLRLKENFYTGISFDYANFYGITTDSTSFLLRDNVSGLNGGANVGVGVSAAIDSRDNRYNPSNGIFIFSKILFYPKFLGSKYQFTKFQFDIRKYYKPWDNLDHIVALQLATDYSFGDVPFYNLGLLGGSSRMRGYYQGAIRDKVFIDSQVEYRMPVWSILGVVAWVGTGRVAENYADLALSGFRISYGAGLRVRVDSKNNINLRLDMGFGPDGINGFYINFAEAF